MPPLFAERFFDAGQKAFVFFVRDSCRISFCPVKYPVGDVPENRPDGILSGCAVILAEEAVFSREQRTGVFEGMYLIFAQTACGGLPAESRMQVICAVIAEGGHFRCAEVIDCGSALRAGDRTADGQTFCITFGDGDLAGGISQGQCLGGTDCQV